MRADSPLLLSSAWLRPVTCLIRAEISLHTDDSIREVVHLLSDAAARVAAHTMTKSAFEDLETLLGFTHHPSNLLLDDTLPVKPISQIMFDWFHIYVVTGIFNYEFAMLMRFMSAATAPITWRMVKQFADPWTHPRTRSNPSYTLTSSSVSDETFHFKCSGGEALSIAPILGFFLQTIAKPMGTCPPQVDSMLCCLDVLEILQRVPTGEVSPELLRRAITKHLTAYQAAYGDIGWVYKHHASMHLPDMLENHKTLISLFTAERRHKVIKRHLVDRRTLCSFETGVMEEITSHHKAELLEHVFDRGVLLNPVSPKPTMARALRSALPNAKCMIAARQFRTASGAVVTAGDVVLFDYHGAQRVGEVWFFSEEQSSANQFACLSVWDASPATSDTAYCQTFLKADHPQLLPAAAIATPCIHLCKSGKVSVLIPAEFRA